MNGQKIELLLLSAKEAAKLLGICRNHFYTLHNSGRLGPLPIRLGRRVLWSRKELEAWIAVECPARRQWQQLKKIKYKVKIA
jgi:excisionase family DNA binding protein